MQTTITPANAKRIANARAAYSASLASAERIPFCEPADIPAARTAYRDSLTDAQRASLDAEYARMGVTYTHPHYDLAWR
jgi:hypothetical protein